MKVLKSCTFGKVYKGLPGLCITLTFAIAIAITGSLGYLFFTTEILNNSPSESMLPMAFRPAEKRHIPVRHEPRIEESMHIPVPGLMPASHTYR